MIALALSMLGGVARANDTGTVSVSLYLAPDGYVRYQITNTGDYDNVAISRKEVMDNVYKSVSGGFLNPGQVATGDIGNAVGTAYLKVINGNTGVVYFDGGFCKQNATSGYLTDNSGQPTTKPVSANGGSCRVWASRVGDVGTVNIDQVALPTGCTGWQALLGTGGGNGAGAGYAMRMHQLPTNSDTANFNLSGLPDPQAEYVKIQYQDAAGATQVIFEGNLQFPAGTSTASTMPALPAISESTSVPTYSSDGPGNPDPTAQTQPVSVGPNVPGAQSTSSANGGGGISSSSVWTQADPTAPTTQSSRDPGAVKDQTGTKLSDRIASAKSWTDQLAFSWSSLNPTQSDDYVVSVNAGMIGNVPLAFAIHTVPDTSTAMGAALDEIRQVFRAFSLCLVVITSYRSLMVMLRRI